MKRYAKLLAMCYLAPFLVASQGYSNDAPGKPTDTFHEKGIGVIRSVFPSKGEVWDISLKWSRDGETYYSANVGLPRPWRLFRSVSYSAERTTVLIPVAAFFATSEAMLFFREPGKYWFRTEVDFRDVDKPRTVPDQRDASIEPVVVDQVFEVEPLTKEDLDFIAGLADPALMRAMFGEDFFEQLTGNAVEQYADPEVQAVKVIGRLLSATRDDWAGDIMRVAGPRGDIRKAAEMLLSLAKRFPESSYAPYAAHYAGCCYFSACIDKAEEGIRVRTKQGRLANDLALGRYRVALLKQNPDTARAYEAFSLAAQRGDDYLKPRTLYQHGTMRLFSFDFDEAERLLTEATRVAPGERMLEKWFDKKFGGIAQLHTYIEKAKVRVQDVEDSVSDTPTP